MKEVNIHDRWDSNLCSIKSVEDIHSDRMYIISLVESFYNMTGRLLYVDVSRPNYDVNDIIEHINRIQSNICDLFIGPNYFELSFAIDKDKIVNEVFYVISELWFAFEHPCFCFFLEEKNLLFNKRSTWYDTTEKTLSFVMFKDAEEDVVWVGKSRDLEWPEFLKSSTHRSL